MLLSRAWHSRPRVQSALGVQWADAPMDPESFSFLPPAINKRDMGVLEHTPAPVLGHIRQLQSSIAALHGVTVAARSSLKRCFVLYRLACMTKGANWLTVQQLQFQPFWEKSDRCHSVFDPISQPLVSWEDKTRAALVACQDAWFFPFGRRGGCCFGRLLRRKDGVASAPSPPRLRVGSAGGVPSPPLPPSPSLPSSPARGVDGGECQEGPVSRVEGGRTGTGEGTGEGRACTPRARCQCVASVPRAGGRRVAPPPLPLPRSIPLRRHYTRALAMRARSQQALRVPAQRRRSTPPTRTSSGTSAVKPTKGLPRPPLQWAVFVPITAIASDYASDRSEHSPSRLLTASTGWSGTLTKFCPPEVGCEISLSLSSRLHMALHRRRHPYSHPVPGHCDGHASPSQLRLPPGCPPGLARRSDSHAGGAGRNPLVGVVPPPLHRLRPRPFHASVDGDMQRIRAHPARRPGSFELPLVARGRGPLSVTEVMSYARRGLEFFYLLPAALLGVSSTLRGLYGITAFTAAVAPQLRGGRFQVYLDNLGCVFILGGVVPEAAIGGLAWGEYVTGGSLPRASAPRAPASSSRPRWREGSPSSLRRSGSPANPTFVRTSTSLAWRPCCTTRTAFKLGRLSSDGWMSWGPHTIDSFASAETCLSHSLLRADSAPSITTQLLSVRSHCGPMPSRSPGTARDSRLFPPVPAIAQTISHLRSKALFAGGWHADRPLRGLAPMAPGVASGPDVGPARP